MIVFPIARATDRPTFSPFTFFPPVKKSRKKCLRKCKSGFRFNDYMLVLMTIRAISLLNRRKKRQIFIKRNHNKSDSLRQRHGGCRHAHDFFANLSKTLTNTPTPASSFSASSFVVGNCLFVSNKIRLNIEITAAFITFFCERAPAPVFWHFKSALAVKKDVLC